MQNQYPVQARFRIASSEFTEEITEGVRIDLKFGSIPLIVNEWLFISRGYDIIKNPIQFINNGAFVRVTLVDDKLYSVSEVIPTHDYLEYLNTKNHFAHITDHLDYLGIGKQVEQLKVGEQFMGVIECCICGIPSCASQSAWIIKKDNGFVIPFFYDEGEILPCLDLIKRFGDYDTDDPVLLNDYCVEFDEKGYISHWYDEDGNDRLYPFLGKSSDYKIDHEEYYPKKKWRPYIP